MPRLSESVRWERDGALSRVDRAVAARRRADIDVVLAAIEALGCGCSMRDVAHHSRMDHRTLKEAISRVTGGNHVG